MHKNKIIVGVVSLIAALLVFQAGIFVGYHKAAFSFNGGDRFYRMMEGQPGPQMMAFDRDDLSTSHGASGKIVSVSLPTFIVAAPNNLEKTVTVNGQTIIRRFRDTVEASDIHTGDFVLVLGDPDDAGSVNARFVRLMPAPSLSAASSTR